MMVVRLMCELFFIFKKLASCFNNIFLKILPFSLLKRENFSSTLFTFSTSGPESVLVRERTAFVFKVVKTDFI